MDLLYSYLNWLFEMLKNDIELYNNWWMWVFLLIPAFGYTIFFFFKWFLITAPIWITFNMILGPARWMGKVIRNIKIKPTDKNGKPLDDPTLEAIRRWAKKDAEKERARLERMEADAD